MLIMKADSPAFRKIFSQAGSENEPVIFPTDTIYGIGASVKNIAANEKIYEIKGREMNKPFPVLVGSLEQAEEIAELSPAALNLMKNCPFPCTLVLKAKENLHPLMTLNGKVAVRLPKTEPLADFLMEYGAVTATSANLSGAAYQGGIENMVKTFCTKVNFYLYQNNTDTSPSAVVDFTFPLPQIIRKSDIISLDIIMSYANLC
ncbi:threonylcarbamoyl-AMP synthase [Geovibrio thiophilus]|uniref:L-threonylcarbamoyladenylate synthase n=1 Tax=Geovibrio thiophilus TaxID=139438 RepID=A0A410JXT7_9BACT|nr:L-threonylcarbamoyladenylate synthase [Geovibrio thiophilus]QAR32878.1 threonylcarbamoyl-AMP synthase [Geovibrio thiophilus]